MVNRLKGHFARIDHTFKQKQTPTFVKSLDFKLPKNAKDVYFRDLVGNVSTSTVSYDKTVLTLTPR